jgi:coenzyme PQQ precursor peptide PqqA
MNAVIENSRFYLADLTDPLSITETRSEFSTPALRTVDNGLYGNCKHGVTGGRQASARHGTLCCIPGTVRGVTVSCRPPGRRAGAIRQTLYCGASLRGSRRVVENPAWSLRGNERQCSSASRRTDGATLYHYMEEAHMQWTTPSYTDMRFGFEITMYIATR